MNADRTGAVLKIIKGKRTGESFRLPASGSLVVGRDTACDVQLLESGVSRNHFEIVSARSGFQLRDLGSTNGTFVNGERVLEWALSFGDVVHLGEVKLLFEQDADRKAVHRTRDVTEPLDIGPGIQGRFETDERGIMRLSVLQDRQPQPQRLVQHLDAIYRVGTLVNSTDNLEGILGSLVKTVSEVFGSPRSYIVMLEETGVAAENVVSRAALESGDQHHDISKNIVDETLRGGNSVLLADASEDERFSGKESVMLKAIRSVMCVPIEAHEGILGALYVDSASRPAVYVREDLELLAALGRLAGLAIYRAYLIGKRGEAERALEEQEEEIRQLQKLEAVGRLAGGVAHDFNNMLGVITGYCDMVLLELEEDDPVYESMAEVKAAADRATSLTQQLLAFSRKQMLEPKVMDLNELVEGALKMLARLIGEDVDVRTVLEPGLGKIKADPVQIQQVILNLAVNARDAMPQGGTITIETLGQSVDEHFVSHHPGFAPGRYAMLAVTDTGCGMDKDVRASIFEPFFTTKEEGKGTGLGLSTVYGIVKQSGGEILVYSEPGQGTTFKIYLPVVSEQVRRPGLGAREREALKGSETILVVEDDAAVLRLTARMLRMHGYNVLEARSGHEALLMLHERPREVDLLLTDVVMPGMSGPELSKKLVERQTGIRVLYMSGYTNDAVFHHGLLEDGLNFIQKPFTAQSLAGRVRQVLDEAGSRRS